MLVRFLPARSLLGLVAKVLKQALEPRKQELMERSHRSHGCQYYMACLTCVCIVVRMAVLFGKQLVCLPMGVYFWLVIVCCLHCAGSCGACT